MTTIRLLTIGFVSILSQIVILRELSVAFFGVELIYILAIGNWMWWNAVGVLIGKRKFFPSPKVTGHLFLLLALLILLTLVFIRAIRPIFSGTPGGYLPFGLQLTVLSAGLIPLCLLLGLIFQWVAKTYIVNQGTLAKAYAIESAGGIIGGIVATVLLALGIQNIAVGLICSFTAAVCGISISTAADPGPDKNHRTAQSALLLLLYVILLAESYPMDYRMTRWNHPHLIDSRDTPYSRLTIEKYHRQYMVFENDTLVFDSHDTSAEAFVHLAALQHPAPRFVMIAGGGMEGLITEMNKHHPVAIDYLEVNRHLIDWTRRYLPDQFTIAGKSSNLSIIARDPRSFKNSLQSYDLIVVGGAQPTSGQSNRLYTLEFFQQCEHLLNKGGILAIRLESSENVFTKLLEYRNASVYQALAATFQDVLVMPGEQNIILASNHPLSRTARLLIERYQERRINARFIIPPFITYIFSNDRFLDVNKRFSIAAIPPNSDKRPICYWYSIAHWVSLFFPRLMNREFKTIDFLSGYQITLSASLLFLLLCLGFWLSGRKDRRKRVLRVAVAGFSGMVLETLLLLYYQSINGILYQNIGILLTLFMAGLAAGALLVQKQSKNGIRHGTAASATINRTCFAGLLLLALFLLLTVRYNLLLNLAITALYLFWDGLMVSGIFSCAGASARNNQEQHLSPLYAADLLGGCAGALLASLLAIPFLGIEFTSAAVILITAAAIVS